MMQTAPNASVPQLAALLLPKKKPTIDELSDILGGDDDLSDVEGHAAGVIFVDPDGHVLLLKRAPSEKNYGGHWGLPGGKADDGETPEQAATREAREETGGSAPAGKKHLLSSVRTPNNMAFHTFVQPVDKQFTPTFPDGEHTEHAWADPDNLPSPVHPGVMSALASIANDSSEAEWWEHTERERDRAEKARENQDLIAVIRAALSPPGSEGEEGEGEGGEDESAFEEGKHPRAPDGKFGSGGGSKASSPKRIAEKLKAHAETLKKHSAAALEFVKDKPALEVLATVAKHEKAKEGLSVALQSLFSHASGVDQSTWKLNEELIDHTVMHFADIAAITALQAKDLMRRGVEALIKQREAMKAGKTVTQGHDEEDGVLAALRALLDVLSEDDGAAEDAEFSESDHPRAPDGKFGSGGGGGVSTFVTESSKKNWYDQINSAEEPEGKEGEYSRADAAAHISAAIRADLDAKLTQRQNMRVAYAHEGDKLRGAGLMTRDRATGIAKIEHVGSLAPGAGAAVMKQLLSEAKSWKAKAVELETTVPEYYERFGFKRVGESEEGTKMKLALDAGHLAADSLPLALDRESVRGVDKDGRLHVEVSNISKANVCEYKGDEIPRWSELGLDPNRIYKLLRDPEELKKGAPTLNGVQLLRKHIPVSADDHKPYDTVGAIGTTASFEHPYLRNGLTVWSKPDIEDIESGNKKELSAGYHYTPDMTPGLFEGEAYDGVMRDIVFNHVALVEDGRAGPDVVVGDSADELMWDAIARALDRSA